MGQTVEERTRKNRFNTNTKTTHALINAADWRRRRRGRGEEGTQSRRVHERMGGEEAVLKEH